MRIIFIAMVVLAVLGAGAAGAYFYFGKNDAIAASGEDAHDSGHGAEAESHFEFVELSPLVLPILDQNGVKQIVSLVIVVEVTDHSGVEKVERIEPRLTDAYIQELYGMLNLHAAHSGGAIQVGKIKQRLNTITVRLLGEDVVNDILLQVVQQRPV